MGEFIFWTCYVFIIGLCIGSFLNVVVLRGLSGESIVLPPSHCTKCNHKLAWYDNIPVLSYLILLGKCRYCKEKISIQYPLVELFTGLTFAGIFYKFAHFGFSVNILCLMIAASLLIVIAVTDIKEKVILTVHTYILAALGLIYNFFNFAGTNNTKIHFFAFGFDISIYQTFIYSFLGMIAGFCVMNTLAWLCRLITKKDCFGDGDAYITGSLGAFFGIANIIVIFILSIIIWGVLCIPSFLYKLFKEKDFKLLSTLVLFCAAAFLFALGEYFDIFDSNLFHWFAYLLVACIGLYCCKLLIASIKQGSKLMVIPFGPALVFAAFIVLFVLF
ncbi:MAG: prepilin peptidase [Clostridium sp.]|nr:prepilin peptidase [Clostridium sp.]